MAELTHEQLWHLCQRKPGDYEPYGQRVSRRFHNLKVNVLQLV
jgi:hypothetical protein